jgi:hypothetical protein
MARRRPRCQTAITRLSDCPCSAYPVQAETAAHPGSRRRGVLPRALPPSPPAATVIVEADFVNALISRRSASYVPPRRIGGAGRGAMLSGAVSRDELCQIVLHQGLNEPAGKLE